MEALYNLVPAMIGMGGAVETLICIVVAMIVLRLELQRRVQNRPGFGSSDGSRYAENCKRILREFAPEAAGLIACLTLAAALRARGDKRPADDQVWAQIKEQWPLLMTADTLLSLQAMLRLVVLLSAVLRAGGGGPVPLADEAAALWLGAGLSRVLLVSRCSLYMLDGPLGGLLPVACEVAVLPLLFSLGRGALRRAPVTLALVFSAAACFATRNRLQLADDSITNSLFMMAHSLDLLAAFVYLVRVALIDHEGKGILGDVSVAFAHLLMPVQQALSAYYFLRAFEYSESLVGSGRPFESLQISNTAQLGAYLAAAALYIAERCDRRAQEAAMSAHGSLATAGGTVVRGAPVTATL